MRAPPAAGVLLGLLVLAFAAVAQAQRMATLELGFGGAVVADAWNPLRLVLRDVGPVQFELVIDQGSLREGEVPLVYRANVRGGSGLSVFDDEVFVPTWRTLAWTVRAGAVTVASGSLPRADGERRPVDLIVTASPGTWSGRVGDGVRVVDVTPDRLVPRSAAYDGVRSVIVSGEGAPPRTDALVAAAAAGAVVVMTDAALAVPELAALAPVARDAVRRVGAGWVARQGVLDAGSPVLEAFRPDHAAAVSAFAGAERLDPPRSLPTPYVLFGAAAYVLAVLVVLRFGGSPGLLAAAVLAISTSVVAWGVLRPEDATYSTTRDLVIGGGESLGQRWRVHDLLSLPAAELRLDVGARPVAATTMVTGPAGTSLELGRWRGQQLVERPRLVPAALRWDEHGGLHNDGPAVLLEVHVRDGSAYAAIAPGATAVLAARDPAPPSTVATALLDVVPSGAAIARDDSAWYVALPAAPPWPAATDDGRVGGEP
jgi:hypothetical protein